MPEPAHMIPDPDIFRPAKPPIDQRGEDAPLRAAELFEDGDIEGAAVWHRILAAIGELRRKRRESEPINRRRAPQGRALLPL